MMEQRITKFIDEVMHELYEMDYCPRQIEYMSSKLTKEHIEQAISHGVSPYNYAIELRDNFEGGLWP